jgi:hypothetical protein
MKFVGLHSVFIVRAVYATVDARHIFRMVVDVTSVVCRMSYFGGGGGEEHGSTVLRLHFLQLNGRKLEHSIVGIGNCSQMIRKLRSQSLHSVLNFTRS